MRFRTARSLGSTIRRTSLTWSEIEPKLKQHGVQMLIVEKESDFLPFEKKKLLSPTDSFTVQKSDVSF